MITSPSRLTHPSPSTHLFGYALAICCALSVGCTEQIEVENRPAEFGEMTVPTAGPNDTLALEYELSDSEQDDQNIRVEICNADGTQCGFPFQAPGSDGTTFLPTGAFDTALKHQFLWDTGCGRVVEDAVVATTLTQQYIARISIRSTTNSQETEAFSLDAIGLGALSMCSK